MKADGGRPTLADKFTNDTVKLVNAALESYAIDWDRLACSLPSEYRSGVSTADIDRHHHAKEMAAASRKAIQSLRAMFDRYESMRRAALAKARGESA